MSLLRACLLSASSLSVLAGALRGDSERSTADQAAVRVLLDTRPGPGLCHGGLQPPGERHLPDLPLAVRDLHRRVDGWSVAETDNFQIFHNQKPGFVAAVARVAERTRLAMHRKWFGGVPEVWRPRCKIYLHANYRRYLRDTGIKGTEGHALIRLDGGQVDSRSIHAYCTAPNLLYDVVPHEVTHAVLAGHFGAHHVPRWADEGMALLSQPRDSLDEFTCVLPGHHEDGDLFATQILMTTDDATLTNTVEFYAQSVSLVDFLVSWKGPQEFTQFLWDSFHTDYEQALQRHYGLRGFAELDRRWQAYAFGEDPPPEGFVRTLRRVWPACGPMDGCTPEPRPA